MHLNSLRFRALNMTADQCYYYYISVTTAVSLQYVVVGCRFEPQNKKKCKCLLVDC